MSARAPADEAARLFDNRGRFASHEGAPALGFVTPERVRLAMGLASRGTAVALAMADAPRPVMDALSLPQEALVARGVLLDVAHAAGRPWLPDAASIGPASLDATAERQGVALESGDALFVRTGFASGLVAGGESAGRRAPAPGIGANCARWLYERQVSWLAADTPEVEVQPAAAGDTTSEALRTVARDHTGIVFVGGVALDALAQACARDGEWAFLLVCAPPDADGAVSPVAIR